MIYSRLKRRRLERYKNMVDIPQIPVLDEFGNVIHYANDHKNGTQFLRIIDGNLVGFWKIQDAISMDKLNQTHPEIDLDHRIWRLQGEFYVLMDERDNLKYKIYNK